MSLYRIASANAYDRTVQNINRRQTEIAQSQEQLSSGKRVLRASDDAVAATLAARARNRLARDPPRAFGGGTNSNGYPGFMYTAENLFWYAAVSRRF